MANYPGWCSGSWNDQEVHEVFPGIMERPHDPGHAGVLRVPTPEFPSLQQALDAALPGDTILLLGPVNPGSARSFHVNKSLTIEAEILTRVSADAGAHDCCFVITGLTPGLPLVMRNLDIVFHDDSHSRNFGGTLAVDCAAGVGSIVMEGCRITFRTGYLDWFAARSGATLLSVVADSLWMRDCEVVAEDLGEVEGCNCGQWHAYDAEAVAGINAANVSVGDLYLENCRFVGGNGTSLRGDCVSMACCVQGYGDPILAAGDGGFGFDGGGGAEVVVACEFSDAPGGAVTGSCYGYTIQSGQPGSSRGPANSHAASVEVQRPALQGGFLSIRSLLGGGSTLAVAVGVSRTRVSTPWGVLHLEPLDVFALPSPPAQLSLLIPANASLAGLPVIAQGIRIGSVFEILNPSMVYVR
jgi:hypothetical protein